MQGQRVVPNPRQFSNLTPAGQTTKMGGKDSGGVRRFTTEPDDPVH